MYKIYSADFYKYINAGSVASARAIVPKIIESLAPESILDVGCGAGAWCSVWIENQVLDVYGLDGNYVEKENLLINEEKFKAVDLSKIFSLGKKFDLVTSLEVAEHIPADCSDDFVKNLTDHSDMVLFSAAVPGQGGEFHINEQPLEYWRLKFAEHKYYCFDLIRDEILQLKEVEPWYRYNILLYVAEDRIDYLSEEIKNKKIDRNKKIPDVSPFSWRFRNWIIRLLPRWVVEFLAKIKHFIVRRKNDKF